MSSSDKIRWALLRPGQSLGRDYVVEDLIGSGYEGEVYKIRETETGIERAAKIYYEKRNPNGKILRRYVRKLQRLSHVDSVLRFHRRDRIRVNGSQLGVMISELAQGKLLSQMLSERSQKKFSSFEALHLLRAIALSVVPIHSAREYHGDLHTENIFVKRRGVEFDIKLLDFFDLGRFTKRRMEEDVIDMVGILFELVGGSAHYRNSSPAVKRIVRGRKHSLILSNCRNATDLVNLIDSLD